MTSYLDTALLRTTQDTTTTSTPISSTPLFVSTTNNMTDDTPPRILHSRDHLMQHGLYLAAPTVLQNVQWQQQGRKDFLISTPNQNEPPSLAVLSIIGTIADQSFWLTSDAGWRGPTEITPSLADAKATCIASFPQHHQLLQQDFHTALDHVHALQNLVATPNVTTKQGFAPTGVNHLKFRHVLFEPTNDNDLEGTLPLSQWPVHNNTAREALRQMGTAFRAIPIPAYDIEDRLIPPAQYRPKLCGALAEINFHLSHTSFPTKDSYTADITCIRVLRSPNITIDPPKRKLPQTFHQTHA